MQKKLSIIIVSYNAKDFLLQTLDSVFESTYKYSYDVVVVENNSSDDSLSALQAYPHPIKIIPLEKTVGFSEANNLGVEEADGEYLFFLNPDTKLQENSMQILTEQLERDTTLGAVSGQLLNKDGSIQPQGGSLPNLLNVFLWMFFIDDLFAPLHLMKPYQQRSRSFFRKEQDTGWIGGTAFLISSSLFKQVGGWDWNIFLYGEDVELCYRIHKLGKKIRVLPSAKITHFQHKSTGGSARSLVGEFSGLLYLWKKHHSAWELPILKLLLLFGAWLRVLVFGILLGDEAKRRTYLEIQKRIILAG